MFYYDDVTRKEGWPNRWPTRAVDIEGKNQRTTDRQYFPKWI